MGKCLLQKKFSLPPRFKIHALELPAAKEKLFSCFNVLFGDIIYIFNFIS